MWEAEATSTGIMVSTYGEPGGRQTLLVRSPMPHELHVCSRGSRRHSAPDTEAAHVSAVVLRREEKGLAYLTANFEVHANLY